MKSEQISVDQYLEMSYTVTLRRDDEGDWIARVQEFSGCTAHGSTKAEALQNLEEVQRVWIEDALEAGESIPRPAEENLPSGKWLQRAPRSLHQKLIQFAKQEGVSFNQFVTSVLAEAVGRRVLPHPATEEHMWGVLHGAERARIQLGSALIGTEVIDLTGAKRHGTQLKWYCGKGEVGSLLYNNIVAYRGHWTIQQPSPPASLHVAENLVTTASEVSNRLETTLKVSERESKKEERGHKAYTVGI